MICKTCDKDDYNEYELLDNNKNLEYKILTKNFFEKNFANKKYDIVLIEN
jgi:hypothetical protein